MSESVCALAAETKVETPEGALAIRTIVGKAIAVFAREPAGRVRFRMMVNVRKTAEQQPVVKVTLENGQSFRVAPQQVLYKKGMVECPAGALQAGDDLEPAFSFPAGYRFHDDAAGSTRESSAALRVALVEPAGAADIYALGVNQAGCFFLTAGVLCKADDTADMVAAATST